MFMANTAKACYRWPSVVSVGQAPVHLMTAISSLDDGTMPTLLPVTLASDLLRTSHRRGKSSGEAGSRDPAQNGFLLSPRIVLQRHVQRAWKEREDQEKVNFLKRYFLHGSDSEGVFTLRATGDTPYFHHVATLAELKRVGDAGTLYTYHFNMPCVASWRRRRVSSATKTSPGLLGRCEDEAFYNRALNL